MLPGQGPYDLTRLLDQRALDRSVRKILNLYSQTVMVKVQRRGRSMLRLGTYEGTILTDRTQAGHCDIHRRRMKCLQSSHCVQNRA